MLKVLTLTLMTDECSMYKGLTNLSSVVILPGGTSVISEPNHALDSSVHYNIPELQSAPGRSASSSSSSSAHHHHPAHSHAHPHHHPHPHPHSHPHPQPNGPHCPLPPPRPEHAGPRNELSADEDSDDEEYEDEDEAPTSRWQGIEAIFEAYQEYIEGTSSSSALFEISIPTLTTRDHCSTHKKPTIIADLLMLCANALT